MAYASVEELARVLKVSSPSPAQLLAMQRVLDSAATEIDAYLGRGENGAPLSYEDDEAPALVVEVNIERAVEHWKQQEVPFGLIGIGSEGLPAHIARDTWDRHARKLDSLVAAWGFA